MYSPTMHYHVSIMDPSDPLGMPAYETTDLVNVSRDVASGEYDAFVTFGDDDDAVPARIEVRWTRVEMTSVVDRKSVV